MESLLIDYFQRAAELKREMAERFSAPLMSAVRMLTTSLIADGRVFVCGDTETDFIADSFQRQLLYGYQIERPGLPCIKLAAARKEESQASQLRSLAAAGDTLVVLASPGEQQSLTTLCRSAVESGLGIILVCAATQESLLQSIGPDNIELSFQELSKAQLLESYLSVSLTLAALIDHQLFGSEL